MARLGLLGAYLEGYAGTILQENVHRLLCGGIVEDSVVEGRVTQAVTHRHTGASFQQNLHDVAELGGLGDGLGEEGGAVHVLDIKLDVGMITEEGLEETFVSQATDFLQFFLHWTECWVNHLRIQNNSGSFSSHLSKGFLTFGTTSGIIEELFGQKSTSSLSSSSPR